MPHQQHNCLQFGCLRQASRLNRIFDRILLDVPCSGNFASDDHWLNRRTFADIERNAKMQREILAAAVKHLTLEGEMVYSTCSLEPEEDELNMDWAVKNLGLKIQEIDCIGENGLVDVFGMKLDPQVANCRRIWPRANSRLFCLQTKKGEISMRPIEVFASRFGNEIAFNKELIVEKNQRYYLFNPRLKKDVQYDFYYAGLYLGKIGKNGGFFPSFNLLSVVLVDVVANKMVIDQKAAWLFICGRGHFL